VTIATRSHSELHTICDAIRARRRLAFEYDGQLRVVEPYCHGWGAQGGELLRAIQVAGSSRSRGFGFGKLWKLDRMRRVKAMDQTFVPSDPHYNPNDSAMARIHCRIER
jgi:hypothetical protein